MPLAVIQAQDSAQVKAKTSCAYFTVVTRDKLNNVKQGLSPADVKWFQKSFAKKYPASATPTQPRLCQ